MPLQSCKNLTPSQGHAQFLEMHAIVHTLLLLWLWNISGMSIRDVKSGTRWTNALKVANANLMLASIATERLHTHCSVVVYKIILLVYRRAKPKSSIVINDTVIKKLIHLCQNRSCDDTFCNECQMKE